jgi:hypothetical protein
MYADEKRLAIQKCDPARQKPGRDNPVGMNQVYLPPANDSLERKRQE